MLQCTECDILAIDKWRNKWNTENLQGVTQIEDAFVTQTIASNVIPLWPIMFVDGKLYEQTL